MMKSNRLLERDTTICMRGIFACMVLFSHIHGRVSLFSTSLLGTMFSAFGYLAVSGFFLLSGYGLYEQYQKKGTLYAKQFPQKNILPFYIVYVCSSLLYLIDLIFLHNTFDYKNVLLSFFYGSTIVANGWYLQTQMLLYLVFYVSILVFKKKPILATVVGSALYCAGCVLGELPSTWYEAVFCFSLGMIVSKYKPAFSALTACKKRLFASIGGLLIVFLITLLFGNKTILPEATRIAVKMISSLSFALLAVLASGAVRFVRPVFGFLGRYSLEIYIVQGLFLKHYRDLIQNDWLYMLVVIGSVLTAAFFVKPLFDAAKKLVGKKAVSA